MLLGMVLAVAMVCSIPLYTNGILQRMLIKDLENYQIKSNQYPGKYEIRVDLYQYFWSKDTETYKTYNFFANKIQDSFVEQIGIKKYIPKRELTMDYLFITPEEYFGNEDNEKLTCKVTALEGFYDNVQVVSGRLPDPEPKDDVIECAIFAQLQKDEDIILDKVYYAKDYSRNKLSAFKIKPVGIIAPKQGSNAWWDNAYQYYNTFIIDYGYMRSNFLYELDAITTAKWLYQFDYTTIDIEDLDSVTDAFDAQQEWFDKYLGAHPTFRVMPIFKEYYERAEQLRLTLWVLQAPILIMLAFYIFMVAQLVVENDRNEISVLKSRGASRWQILSVYLIQNSVLALLACIAGPFLGVLICKMIGAANGFLEFVSRTALPIKMTQNAVLYSLLAGVFSIGVIMAPVFKASKVNIVELKQKKSRKWNAPWWQKIFLDVILLGVSLYSLNDYMRQGQVRLAVEDAGLKAPIDPFMFIILTLFILGIGLFFLRIYPLIIRMVYSLGKKKWSPSLYSSFIHVSRTSGREQFLMLFLILSLAVGIFSANSARSINQNIEDRAGYDVGCDMKLMQYWRSNEASDTATPYESEPQTSNEREIIYKEPPFSIISGLEGTENAAKVFRADSVTVKADSQTKKGELMAINPYDFGKVVWKSENLLPHHINEYLNLMSYSKAAVIVSEAYRDELGLEVGDSIMYSWARQASLEGIIVAFAQYWPGINPYESDESKYFIVSNLDYVQVKTAMEPYEVWFKTQDGVPTKTIYNSIEENKIILDWVEVLKQEIIKQKNDPFLQGINGAMTLSFIVTMAISLIGFIIYWILSIKARVLQFGIFRAMGMTKRNVLTMIAAEQVLISFVAIAMGIFIGGLSCRLFLPLLQVVGAAAEQVPPFRLVAALKDYIKLYSVVFVMLAGGFAFIGMMVSKIKVAQVIKLGED